MLLYSSFGKYKKEAGNMVSLKKFSRQIRVGNLFIFLIFFSFFSCNQVKKVTITNPIVAGYYADPSIIKHDGTYYIYATIDPWGTDSLAVLSSTDFKNWKSARLNWPTKAACTGPTSSGNMVWAPSVIKAKNGKFYMYVSVGSEVWVGVSEQPLGPWKNAKEDNSPLIPATTFRDYHMIDAEVFIDDNGEVYLYWGSGWNWTNGHCFVVRLSDDMVSIKGAPVDVTPPNYFEAPFMLKNKGKYYLMYSDGLCYNETYKVRYSVGNSPLGPWTEGENSPILTTSVDSVTVGPGHHTVFQEKGQHYILYHRVHENNKEDLFRELCVDSLNFNSKGLIEKVKTNGGFTLNK